MIKLERNVFPAFLTPSEKSNRTAQFKANGEAVWADQRIKDLLLALSFGKCAYCECDLTTESKYMEVEHFACKDEYPDEVVEWTNLLPSCKRCNTTKGSHNVKVEPIINPFDDIPADHFSFSAYRLRPLTKKGEVSNIVLGLNNQTRAVKIRFQIGEQIHILVDSAIDRLNNYLASPTGLRQRKLLENVEGLLNESLPSVPYAATAATILHKNSDYPKIKAQMEANGIWNGELQSLHEESLKICL